MDIYFTQATYLNNIYKLSDFYSGTNYIQNANKKLSVNLTASDGITTVVCPGDTLPDDTSIRDYTHIMVPSMTKIYEITSFQYINDSQVRLNLSEDALIGHYQTLKTKKVMLNRSNDTSKFVGLNDVKDIAIKHTASVTGGSVPANWTGYWAVFAFQADTTVKFTFNGPINKSTVPFVGDFASVAALELAYPVGFTLTPYAYDYFLKFATIGSAEYQCVYLGTSLAWTKIDTQLFGVYDDVHETYTYYNDASVNGALYGNSELGDMRVLYVALPLDMTVSRSVTLNDGVHRIKVPSFWEYVSNDQPDKLLNIRIVPEAFLGTLSASYTTSPILIYMEEEASGPYYMTSSHHSSARTIKILTLPNLHELGGYNYGWGTPIQRPINSVICFQDEFAFTQSGVTYPSDYEPFKKYYLSFYGSLIEIPARYVSDFNVRIAVTTSNILFEVYTDKYNIIGSGDLQWFTRFTVDSLALYQANNPTYKEQFWTSQLTGAIRASTVGAGYGGLQSYKGSVANIGSEFFGGGIQNPPKAAVKGAIGGFAAGAGQAAIGIAGAAMNLHFMEKGMKDKADQIQGINDVALSLIKGFAAYIITISPETEALEQMKASLEMTGFPVSAASTIDDLTAYNVNEVGLGASKLIVGKLLETVKNASITMMIDTKLQEGVIII